MRQVTRAATAYKQRKVPPPFRLLIISYHAVSKLKEAFAMLQPK